jgi:methionyl aminopeptidase
MSFIKSQDEINKIREGGQILHRILRELAEQVKPGVSTWDLNEYAEAEIAKAGGESSFKGYGEADNPFPAALCTSVNDAVVHGIPNKDVILKEGDIVGLDIGMKYKGLYSDTAITVPVGKVDPKIQKLLDVTKKSLSEAIKQAKAGNTIGDIAYATQAIVEKAGFNVVRDLVGHGVGHGVHEEPSVPNYGRKGAGMKLVAGMVLAIEPMVVMGGYKLKYEDDDWTIVTKDRSYSAHFEHTVAIGEKGADILT